METIRAIGCNNRHQPLGSSCNAAAWTTADGKDLIMKTIRLAELADARGVAEIYAPSVEGSPISFETAVPTAQEMEGRIAAVLTFAPWLVCVGAERVEGYAYASRHHERAAYRWSVDVSVYVCEGCRRAGVGRALYAALLALLRAQGFCAAHAGITLPNEASVGLHESFGFRPVGVYPSVGFKGGVWHDVGWWQLGLRDRSGEPAPTSSMAVLRRSAQWDEAIAAGRALLSR
jgi:L-amino acid N-acyltransferase YncA